MKIEVCDVVKTFGAVRALDGASFETGDEVRVVALIGPSGGGKSTLLRVLGGLEAMDSGVARLGGVEVPRIGPELLGYRRRNGFVFQQWNLFPHLSVRENIALPLREVRGVGVTDSIEEAERQIERLGLEGFGDRMPGQMSGGQQQRVALARALAHGPEWLFLDEPTSALDPEMTAEVLDLIGELTRGGQRVVLSTHEIGFAREVADYGVFLKEGKVVESGGAEGFFGAPRDEGLGRFLERLTRFG